MRPQIPGIGGQIPGIGGKNHHYVVMKDRKRAVHKRSFEGPWRAWWQYPPAPKAGPWNRARNPRQ
jgi:hypothetical protein